MISICMMERERMSMRVYVCAVGLACVSVSVHRGIDKLSVVPLSLSDRILMLIPMVNSPETFHRKLIERYPLLIP